MPWAHWGTKGEKTPGLLVWQNLGHHPVGQNSLGRSSPEPQVSSIARSRGRIASQNLCRLPLHTFHAVVEPPGGTGKCSQEVSGAKASKMETLSVTFLTLHSTDLCSCPPHARHAWHLGAYQSGGRAIIACTNGNPFVSYGTVIPHHDVLRSLLLCTPVPKNEDSYVWLL
jgi:hypothetical protein